MRERRNLSSSLSAKVIQFLRQKGYSQVKIARMLHVTEGFVSLVKSRERSLTLSHLELLSQQISIPVGALLIAVTEPRKGSAFDKEFFAATARILKLVDNAHAAILRDASKKSRKSA